MEAVAMIFSFRLLPKLLGILLLVQPTPVTGILHPGLDDYDVWIVKLSLTGTIASQSNYGGSRFEESRGDNQKY